MPPFPSLTHLPASIVWALFGLPLCIVAGVAWDGFQDPSSTQQFLGAANNFFFLWLLPVGLLVPLKSLLDGLRGRSEQPWFIPALLVLVGWALFGLWMNGLTDALTTMVLPSAALFVAVTGVVLHGKARLAVKDGHVDALHALLAWSLAGAALGVALGMVVHLAGAMPEKQPFLYTDGFGNIRTLGETALLGLTVGLALNARRFALVPFLLAVALAMVLAWSGTRAAWVGLGATLVIGAVWWAVPLAGVLRWIAAVALGFALSIPLPLPDSNYGAFRAAAVVREATTVVTDLGEAMAQPDAVDTEASDSNRLALWSWGIDRIQESPLVGHGYAAMGAIPDRPEHAKFKHLHNLPLDLVFGLGVPVGLALTLLLAWTALRAMHRARRTDHILLPMVACGTLVTALFSGLFLFPVTVIVVGVGLAGAYARPLAPSET